MTLSLTLYHFIFLAHLFCNWEFAPLTLSPSSFLPPTPSLLAVTCLFFVSLALFCYIWSFVFSDSTCKWNHTIFVFAWLDYHNSLKIIQIVTNGQDFIILLSFCGIYTTYIIPHILYAFIHRWTRRLCLPFSCCEQWGYFYFILLIFC